MLNLLEVQAGEQLYGVHNPICEPDHDTCCCEGQVAPEVVGDERGFGMRRSVVHPCWEGEQEEDAEGEESCGLGGANGA